MNHRDRNAHRALRVTAHRRRLAEHDARCTENRTTPRQRRTEDRVIRWTLIAGALALPILAAIR